jgi:hypothetical protein
MTIREAKEIAKKNGYKIINPIHTKKFDGDIDSNIPKPWKQGNREFWQKEFELGKITLEQLNRVLWESAKMKEGINSEVQKVADAVKGIPFMNMRSAIQKLGRGWKFDNSYTYHTITTPTRKEIVITSIKNADPGEDDIIQDGFIIGLS